jgi:hypothetical protein
MIRTYSLIQDVKDRERQVRLHPASLELGPGRPRLITRGYSLFDTVSVLSLDNRQAAETLRAWRRLAQRSLWHEFSIEKWTEASIDE